MKNICAILMSIFFLIGCSTKEKRNDGNAGFEWIHVSDSLDKAKQSNLFLTREKIIVLEMEGDALISDIGRVYMDDDRIFIFDKKQNKIIIYNTNGAFLSAIHNIGGGPGEYSSLMDFTLDTKRKEVFVLCDKPYKIIKFNYDAKFLTEFQTNKLFSNIALDADTLFCNRTESKYSDPNADKFEIFYFDLAANPIGKDLQHRPDITNSIVTRGNYLTPNRKYTRSYDNSIYKIEKDGVHKIYELDFGKYNLPKRLLSEKNPMIFIKECRTNNYIFSMNSIIESDNQMLVNTNTGICLYDKKTGKATLYHNLTDEDFNTIPTNHFYPLGHSQNHIASIVHPSFIFERGDEIKKKYLDYGIDANAIDEESNPILFIYKLN